MKKAPSIILADDFGSQLQTLLTGCDQYLAQKGLRVRRACPSPRRPARRRGPRTLHGSRLRLPHGRGSEGPEPEPEQVFCQPVRECRQERVFCRSEYQQCHQQEFQREYQQECRHQQEFRQPEQE